MAEQNFKILHWLTYNKALRLRGPHTQWLDESAIAAWTERALRERRARPLHYTEMVITIVLMTKCVFNLSVRALQGFMDSIFKVMGLALSCPYYSLVRMPSMSA